MPAPRSARNEGGLIGHLAAQAAAKPVNSGVSITKYYACAQLLLRQAESYRKAGVEEQEYVMIMRFASLIVETIPKHKDFNAKDPQHKQMKQLLLTKYMPLAEQLKYNLKQRDIIEPMARSRNRPADAVRIDTSELNEVNWGTANPPPPAPQQNYNLDDLLDVVQNGPGNEKPPQPPPPPPPYQSQPRPELPSPPAYQPKYSAANERHDLFLSSLPSSQALSRSTSGALALDQQPLQPLNASPYAQQIQPSTPPGPPPLQRYPSIQNLQQQSQGPPPLHLLSLADGSKARQQQQQQMALQLSAQQQQQQYQQARGLLQGVPPPSAGPTPPPQPIPVVMQDPNLQGVPRSCCTPPPPPPQPGLQTYTTYSVTQQQLQQSQPGYPPLPPPPPPPTNAAQQGQPQQSAPAKEGGGGMREVVKRAQLRDVHVSIALMEEFLAYARSNTAKGIESCGILAGQLSANDSLFTITTLIIPKQQGTTDTVQALNEEEVFDVQFSRELYPLGWIHTHPTQSCFLSSVDVHTHCGYQTMLEEAIAIVMAPNDRSKRCGLFRLSTPGGLQLVQRCNKRGFHPHPTPETGQDLYELCGHVYLNPRTKHEVIDLR